MAIQYFGTFPTIEYNLEKDETDAKTVVDITKRVGIRSDFSEYIGSYYKKLVTDGRRPEIYALSAYGSVLNHWILLHVNEVVDPYFDWVLDYAKFDAYIQKRYPDEVLIYDITSANQYGKNFVIGETITGSESGATAVVKDSKADLGQIVYESGPTWDASTPDIITGSVSGLTANVESTVKEYAAPRFYEVVRDNGDGSEDRLIVDKGFSNTERANLPGGTASWPAPVVVDNATYEYRINEENREIKFLNESLIETFEEEFKEKIQ